MRVDDYLDYLSESRGMSDNTLRAYKKDILAFNEFVERQGLEELDNVTETTVIDYLLSLKNEGKSAATVNRRMASIRSYYQFLQNTGAIVKNPAQDIRSPKISRKKISYLSVEQMNELLSLPDDSVIGKRDRAILEMMYATGVRVSEVIEFRLSDLDLRMGYVSCHGEHGRARIVPVGEPAKRALAVYIKDSRPVLLKDQEKFNPSAPLFVNYLGNAFTRQGFWKVLKQYGDKMDLEEPLTPQSIRNSFAMHMVQNGIDIKSLQELMGHEDITATQVYFGDMKTRIKSIYDRTHPRAK